ncbi:hypothetical protein LOZ48_006872 [Ophidiomyces ophidiicola]|nr:hypothetical protein LOZ48_006872 [Ophidiomyces ophidiicola]
MGTPGIFLGQGLDGAGKGDGANTPDASLQITVVSGDDVNPVFDGAIDNAVVSIRALVVALDALKSGVLGYSQGQAVLGPQLLKFGQNTVGDDGDTLRVQAVHHGGNDLEFMLHGMGEEVGVYEHRVRRGEGGVVLEEEGGRHLRSAWATAVSSWWRRRREQWAYISRTTSSLGGFLCFASSFAWFCFLLDGSQLDVACDEQRGRALLTGGCRAARWLA